MSLKSKLPFLLAQVGRLSGVAAQLDGAWQSIDEATALAARVGVSTVNGRVLDLRYRILDTAKAALLPNEPGGIYVVDEATGATAMLPNSPKTGSIPQNPQKLEAGRTYSLSFPNPGKQFKSGSKLTLVMGSFRAEHLTVQ